MISIEGLGLTILTTRQMSAWTDGAGVLRRLSAYPDLTPEKCGLYEPLSVRFDVRRVDEIAKQLYGRDGFNWKVRKLNQEGSFMRRNSFMHSEVRLSSDYGIGFVPVLTEYLQSECVRLEADIGTVEPTWTGKEGYSGPLDQTHLSTSPEAFENVSAVVGTKQLRRYIGQLSWATCFGPPYVQMFGIGRLLSAPAAVTTQLSENMVYMQLTQRVEDIAADLNGYFSLRHQVKEHIGPNAFFSPAKGKGPYMVPSFDIEQPGRVTSSAGSTLRSDEDSNVPDMKWRFSHDDFEKLAAAITSSATQLLEEHGEFNPFAVVIDNVGNLSLWGAHIEIEEAEASELRTFLSAALRSKAKQGQIRASGICLNVRAQLPGYSDQVDAICVELEHKGSQPVQVFIPFRRNERGELSYDEAVTLRGFPSVFKEA